MSEQADPRTVVPGNGGRGRDWTPWALGGLGAVVAAVAVVVLGTGAVLDEEALPGTTVEGVDVGGLGEADLVARLEQAAAEREGAAVEVAVPGGAVERVDAAGLGYAVDVRASASRALDAGRDGSLVGDTWTALRALVGDERDVELVDRVEPGAVGTLVDRLARGVDAPPVVGDVTVVVDEPPRVDVVEPAPGRTVDRDAARERLADALRTGADAVELPVTETPPPADAERVAELADAARAAVAQPLVLRGEGGATLEVAPVEVAQVLAVRLPGTVEPFSAPPPEDAEDPPRPPLVPRDADAGLVVAREALAALVAPRADALDQRPTPPRAEVVSGGERRFDDQLSTSFSPSPASVQVLDDGAPGLDVDAEAAVAEAEAVLTDPSRTEGALQVAVEPPRVTADELRGVNALLGTFTTYHSCCAGRVTNIHRMADTITGAVLAPGESFGINDYVGRRTSAAGFVPAPTIIDGELEPTVGGGVSQYATTMFNAIFFAGLQIDDFKPHSRYISRYPVGREATVNFPGVELAWTNDTGGPVLVTSTYTGTSITVSIYGVDREQTVRAVTGARRGGGGGPGGVDFRISFRRVIERPGQPEVDQLFTTVYFVPED